MRADEVRLGSAVDGSKPRWLRVPATTDSRPHHRPGVSICGHRRCSAKGAELEIALNDNSNKAKAGGEVSCVVTNASAIEWSSLRHSRPYENDCRKSRQREASESCGDAETVGYPAGKHRAQSGANANGKADQTKGEIVMPGPPGQVACHERNHHSEAGPSDTVQRLH